MNINIVSPIESEFLSEEELIQLTGLKRPPYQKVWLKENGFPFFESRTGLPKVGRWSARLHMAKISLCTARVGFDEPDFNSLT